MKNFKVLIMVYLVLFTIGVFAQQTSKNHFTKMELDSVAIGFSKTTTIVFPYAIKSVDKGSQDVLVQKAMGLENILQIKAAQQGVIQTNLMIVTADGKLYCFVLNYDEQSPQLNLSFNEVKLEAQEVFFSSKSRNEQEVEQYSRLAFFDKGTIHEKENEYDVKLQLRK